MNEELIGNAGLNEQSYIAELRDAYENSVRAITSTETWFSLIYSNSYCDADICGLLKERDTLRAQLAEAQAEVERYKWIPVSVREPNIDSNYGGRYSVACEVMNGEELVSPAFKAMDGVWRHFGEPLHKVLMFREIP